MKIISDIELNKTKTKNSLWIYNYVEEPDDLNREVSLEQKDNVFKLFSRSKFNLHSFMTTNNEKNYKKEFYMLNSEDNYAIKYLLNEAMNICHSLNEGNSWIIEDNQHVISSFILSSLVKILLNLRSSTCEVKINNTMN
ncbi:hypothetical protein HZS_20 [Henneguya salminicola]|nr:hypothetical protein HZS_20 [Henneguya salminicola]